MEIHWVGLADVDEAQRAEIERRLLALTANHDDLIDLRIAGRASGHHQHGGQEVRITCQARGRELVAARTRLDMGLALNEALDAFEREVHRLRRKRRDRSRMQLQEHEVGGALRTLLVHRKGATRALPPGHAELPPEYRETGQPVIIGGSMETGSYVLAGVETGAASFFSTAHGSGRRMSRRRARKLVHGRALRDSMEARGIRVRSASDRGLAEEAGVAYKSVDEVAEATELAGLSRRVAHLVPVGNVKG